MTIAAACRFPEGVALIADSRATWKAGVFRRFEDRLQKVLRFWKSSRVLERSVDGRGRQRVTAVGVPAAPSTAQGPRPCGRLAHISRNHAPWDQPKLHGTVKTDWRGLRVTYLYSKEATEDSGRRIFEFMEQHLGKQSPSANAE